MRLPAVTRRIAAAIAIAAIGVAAFVLAEGASAGAHGVAAASASARTTSASVHAKRRPLAKPADPAASGIGPCPDAQLTPAPGDLARIMRSTLCLINAQRRQYGLVPLVEDPRLDSSAQAHSDDMIQHGYFEHVSPTGSTPVSRMTSAGYLSGNDGYEVGENIAWGTLNLATPASIVTAWMNSPDHRANILRAAFRQEGLGVDASVPGSLGNGQPGATYTQDFGVITGG